MSDSAASPSEFLRFVVSSLVEHPDDLDLSEIEKDRKTTFELGVHPDDLDAVVGSDGQVASALRMVLDACAYKHRTRVSLVIREEPSQGGDSDDQEEASA